MYSTIIEQRNYVAHDHSPSQVEVQNFVKHNEDPWPLDNTIPLLSTSNKTAAIHRCKYLRALHIKLEEDHIQRQNPPRAHFQEMLTALLTTEEVLNKSMDCPKGHITFRIRHPDTQWMKQQPQSTAAQFPVPPIPIPSHGFGQAHWKAILRRRITTNHLCLLGDLWCHHFLYDLNNIINRSHKLGDTKTNLIETHRRKAIDIYLYPRLSPLQQTYTNT